MRNPGPNVHNSVVKNMDSSLPIMWPGSHYALSGTASFLASALPESAPDRVASARMRSILAGFCLSSLSLQRTQICAKHNALREKAEVKNPARVLLRLDNISQPPHSAWDLLGRCTAKSQDESLTRRPVEIARRERPKP